MAAILYTTSDAIRAAVGVTTKEIPDQMLKDQLLESQIRTSLYEWLPAHGTIYSEGTTGTPTELQVHKKELLVLYCVFSGAIRVVEMIMAMRKRVTDGESEVERFDVDWAALLEVLKARLDQVQAALDEIVNPGSGNVQYFGRAVPAYDPVTNT